MKRDTPSVQKLNDELRVKSDIVHSISWFVVHVLIQAATLADLGYSRRPTRCRP